MRARRRVRGAAARAPRGPRRAQRLLPAEQRGGGGARRTTRPPRASARARLGRAPRERRAEHMLRGRSGALTHTHTCIHAHKYTHTHTHN